MSPARLLRDRSGQFAVPALIALPAVFLFVYLSIETTRLSREKIRRQFALDVAASQELSLYTDLLNRLAYINGPWPDRVFKELAVSQIRYYQDYRMGLFPASLGRVSEEQPRWMFRFGPGRAYLNTDYPTRLDGIFFINQEHVSPRMAVFSKVYTLLGDLVDGHVKIFDDLNRRHAVLRKAMWMNLGGVPECPDAAGCADEAAEAFPPLPVNLHRIAGYEDNDDDEKVIYRPPGLFQLATVDKDKLEALRRGFTVRQSWRAPGNYFGVSFAEPVPFVRGFVSVDGGRLWTDPTPKFTSRLTP